MSCDDAVELMGLSNAYVSWQLSSFWQESRPVWLLQGPPLPETLPLPGKPFTLGTETRP